MKYSYLRGMEQQLFFCMYKHMYGEGTESYKVKAKNISFAFLS